MLEEAKQRMIKSITDHFNQEIENQDRYLSGTAEVEILEDEFKLIQEFHTTNSNLIEDHILIYDQVLSFQAFAEETSGLVMGETRKNGIKGGKFKFHLYSLVVQSPINEDEYVAFVYKTEADTYHGKFYTPFLLSKEAVFNVYVYLFSSIKEYVSEVVLINPKYFAYIENPWNYMSFIDVQTKITKPLNIETYPTLEDSLYNQGRGYDVKTIIRYFFGKKKNMLSEKALESLKDLDMNRANRLYNEMVNSGMFEEYNTVNDNIMYVFPDGRMLGSRPYYEERTGDKMRGTFHIHLYKASSDKSIRPLGREHPALDTELGKYYNLVVVSPMDDMNLGTSAGYILLNENVELTDAQQLRVEELFEYGYEFPPSTKEWVKSAWGRAWIS